MSGAEAMIFLVSFVGFFATVFGIVYVKSRENMAMIERGMNPRAPMSGPRPSAGLRYGMLVAGAGLGLLIAFGVDMSINHRMMSLHGEAYEKDYPQIYFSLVALCGGLGLIISHLIERKEWRRQQENASSERLLMMPE